MSRLLFYSQILLPVTFDYHLHTQTSQNQLVATFVALCISFPKLTALGLLIPLLFLLNSPLNLVVTGKASKELPSSSAPSCTMAWMKNSRLGLLISRLWPLMRNLVLLRLPPTLLDTVGDHPRSSMAFTMSPMRRCLPWLPLNCTAPCQVDSSTREELLSYSLVFQLEAKRKFDASDTVLARIANPISQPHLRLPF